MSEDGFRVDTPERAAWAMRKYRQYAQQAAQVTAMAQRERDRIDRWELAAKSTAEGKMEFFAAHLESFAMQQRAKGFKSLDFPDGLIKTRQKREGINLDKSTFVQWALETDREDMLRVMHAPDMDAIKAATVIDNGKVIDPQTGEVIPGAEVTPEQVSVTIVPDLEALDLDDVEEDIDDVE